MSGLLRFRRLKPFNHRNACDGCQAETDTVGEHEMRILAIESSAAAASAALWEDGKIKYEAMINNGERHSRTLCALLASLFDHTGLSAGEIDAFAVSAGPGSFTGVRIGISILKGLAFENGQKCIPVSSLLCAAWPLRNRDGIVCAAMDARVGRVYGAVFRAKDGKLTRLTEDQALPVQEFAALVREYGEPAALCGDAVEILRPYCGDIVSPLTDPGVLRASSVAAAAAEHPEWAVPSGNIAPVYLSLSRAEK